MGYKTDGLYRTQEEIDNGPLQPGKGLGRIRYVDISALMANRTALLMISTELG